MIDCRKIAQDIKDECKKKLSALPNENYLNIIQVSGDAASDAYTKGKKKDCEEVGLKCVHTLLPRETTCYDTIKGQIQRSNADDNCIGIILQLPLPDELRWCESILVSMIHPSKDVDGFLPNSQFKSCTPAAIIHIAKTVLGDLTGKTVTVVGRGKLVGAPLVKLLNEENATIIQCHSKTREDDLEFFCNIADVVVTAVGKPGLLSYDHLHSQRDGVIIDAAICRDENGKLCGDIDKAAYEEIENITTVPGGVGLVTRAMLIYNCTQAARNKYKYSVLMESWV